MGAVESFSSSSSPCVVVFLRNPKKYSAQHFPISGSVLSVYMSFYIYVVCRSVSCVRVPRYRGALSLFLWTRRCSSLRVFLFFFAMPIYIFILHPYTTISSSSSSFADANTKCGTPPFFSFYNLDC